MHALKITIAPPTGKAAVASFQTRCGPLADTSLGNAEAFTCAENRGGAEIRWFAIPHEMNTRALASPVELAPGLTAQVVPASESPAHVPLSGPGAGLMNQMRQQPGFKSASLPVLSSSWLRAVETAAGAS